MHNRNTQHFPLDHHFGIEDARPSISLVPRFRNTPISPAGDLAHPFLGN